MQLSRHAQLLLGAIALAIVFGLFVLPVLPLLGLGLRQTAHCDVEHLGKITDVEGVEFEITESSCKIPFASTEDIRVYASKHGQPKVVVFAYDPGSSYLIAPEIWQVDDRTVVISVGHISSIIVRKEEWEGLTIKYDIRSVAYPEGEKGKR